MIFLNVLIILALLSFITYVIWRNHRYERQLRLKKQQPSTDGEHDKSRSQVHLNELERPHLATRGWLGNLVLSLHQRNNWKGKLVLQLISVGSRVFGLSLFSLSFPFVIIPWLGRFVILPLLLGGIHLNDLGKEILFPDAQTLLNSDKRRLVLYLRAFRNVGANAIRSPIPFMLFPAILSTSDEERLASTMNQLGPFVAIGEKEGRDRGAARFYARDDEWRERVSGLMGRADRHTKSKNGQSVNINWLPVTI